MVIRNKIDPARPASGGDIFCRFQEAWNSLSQEKRDEVKRSHANFSNFLSLIFGPDPSHHQKLYPVIKHGPWNDQVIRLASIPWTRQRIVLGNLASAISSHLPRFQTVIGPAAERINPADMDLLIRESSHFTGVKLRPLFFPSLDDLKIDKQKNVVRGPTARLDVNWILTHPGTQPDWPVLRVLGF
ncbi:hypothetical protein DTO169C6_9257 [Paecilomyces variotii]|nr:hypothetical protein DTO169C6_9257 [Paecilomyces variotii]